MERAYKFWCTNKFCASVFCLCPTIGYFFFRMRHGLIDCNIKCSERRRRRGRGKNNEIIRYYISMIVYNVFKWRITVDIFIIHIKCNWGHFACGAIRQFSKQFSRNSVHRLEYLSCFFGFIPSASLSLFVSLSGNPSVSSQHGKCNRHRLLMRCFSARKEKRK